MFVDEFLHRHVFSFLSGIEQAVELMSHAATLFNIRQNWQTFPNAIAPLRSSTGSAHAV